MEDSGSVVGGSAWERARADDASVRVVLLAFLLIFAGGCGPAGEGDAGDADAATDAATDSATDSGAPGAPVWQAVSGTPAGTGRWGTRLVYVPTLGGFVAFGGSTWPSGGSTAETWAFDPVGLSWSPLVTTGDLPPARYCHCVNYLPDQDAVLLVNGRDDPGPRPPEAFVLDMATLTWTAVTGAIPVGVIGCAVEWMPNVMGGRAVVFGGGGVFGVSDETWLFDPATATFVQFYPVVRPPGRADPGSAYDPVNDRMLIFGGSVLVVPPFEHLDDTWAFDGTNWTELAVAGSHPSTRRYAADPFDEARGRWVLFGGTVELEDRGDLWELDVTTDTWTELTPASGPPPRGFHASGYDPATGDIFVFGGLTQPVFAALADGWRLRFE